MPAVTLYAPDITCDHCIATIGKAVATVDGARFVAGDPDSRSFLVEVERGAVIDAIAAATEAEGYPLGGPDSAPTGGGMAASAGGAHAMGMALPMAGRAPAFTPTYRVERSAAGADIVYTCPCGSTTEVFHYDRSRAEQEVDACCNHRVLIGAGAAQRLRDAAPGFEVVNVQTITMPWGQPVEAAMAIAR